MWPGGQRSVEANGGSNGVKLNSASCSVNQVSTSVHQSTSNSGARTAANAVRFDHLFNSSFRNLDDSSYLSICFYCKHLKCCFLTF